MGRHAVIASQFGAKAVIGLDLGDAVDAAFQNTRHLPGVSIVQGDIYFPPLKDGAFDAAYSLGVLHHLPDPGRGFRALAAQGENRRLVPGLGLRARRKWLDHLFHQPDPIGHFPHSARHSQRLELARRSSVAPGCEDSLSDSRGFGDRLPYSDYIRWLASFSIRKVHAIVLDHALTPVAHYMSRSDVRSTRRGHGVDDRRDRAQSGDELGALRSTADCTHRDRQCQRECREPSWRIRLTVPLRLSPPRPLALRRRSSNRPYPPAGPTVPAPSATASNDRSRMP